MVKSFAVIITEVLQPTCVYQRENRLFIGLLYYAFLDLIAIPVTIISFPHVCISQSYGGSPHFFGRFGSGECHKGQNPFSNACISTVQSKELIYNRAHKCIIAFCDKMT